MTSHAAAIDLGVQGIEATIRTKRSKRFKKLPRLLSSHELSMYWVFRKANLSVDPGDCVYVVADDTVISTAFMRSLCGLLPADEGIVKGDSRSIMVSPPKGRAINGLSVRQAIFMLGGLYGMSDQEIDERAKEVIRMAQVRSILNDRIDESPGYVKSQIAFSVAMVAPVDILAFNGPALVGSPPFQSKCMGRLAEQTQAGRSLLISTSDRELAKKVCNKAILLDEEESITTSVEAALEELQRRAKEKKGQRRKRRRTEQRESEEDDSLGF